MLDHAGLLEKSEFQLDNNQCRQDPERAWEEWKDQEGRHR